MKPGNAPDDLKSRLVPTPGGRLIYRCLGCNFTAGIETLLYTCPDCGDVLLLYDEDFEQHSETPGDVWHRLFDYRE